MSSGFGKLLSAEHGVRCYFLETGTPLTRLLFYLSGEKTSHFPFLYCLRPLQMGAVNRGCVSIIVHESSALCGGAVRAGAVHGSLVCGRPGDPPTWTLIC